MKPENVTARTQRIIKFAALYIASVFLLLFIFSAVSGRFAPNSEELNKTASNFSTVTDGELMHADILLHAELHELQQSDLRYALLSSNATAAEKDRASLATSLSESAMNKSIDSLQQAATGYAASVSAKYATMLNSFRSVLKDRMILKQTEAAITSAGSLSAAGEQKDMGQWRNELLLKDNDIKRLQSEIKILENQKLYPTKSSGANEAEKGETELLKTAFANQQKEYDVLKEKYTALKTENNAMGSQLSELKKPIVTAQVSNNQGTENKIAANKINMLEQKLEGLNADLYFAKIDCNLARTDAQQMISNARQRKELLSESLVMLTNLSRSDDVDVQKKAKEKIARLNHIASTLHD